MFLRSICSTVALFLVLGLAHAQERTVIMTDWSPHGMHSALKLVAQRMKLDPEGSTVTARVGIGPIEGSPGFGLTVELDVSLPNVPDAEQAEQLLERSHKVCPYSNAINGNVEVKLAVI